MTRGDDPGSIGGQYVTQAQVWFDSTWATVSRDEDDGGAVEVLVPVG